MCSSKKERVAGWSKNGTKRGSGTRIDFKVATRGEFEKRNGIKRDL